MSFLGKLFSFSGRANQLEYIGVHLLIILLVLIPYFVLLGGTANSSSFTGIMNSIGSSIMLYLILFLPIIWIDFAVMFRRLHDINQPGWIYFIVFFITFIPIIGFIVYILFFLALLIWPGTKGKNKYDLIECSKCGTINSQLSEKCFSCNTNLKDPIIKDENLNSTNQASTTNQKSTTNSSLSFDKIIVDLDSILFENNADNKILKTLEYINNLNKIEFTTEQTKEIIIRLNKLFDNQNSLKLDNLDNIINKINEINLLIKALPDDILTHLKDFISKSISLKSKYADTDKTDIDLKNIQKYENYQISEKINISKKYIYNKESIRDELTNVLNAFNKYLVDNHLESKINELKVLIEDFELLSNTNTFIIVSQYTKIMKNEDLHISIRLYLKEKLNYDHSLFDFNIENFKNIYSKSKELEESLTSLDNIISNVENLNIDTLYSNLKLLEKEQKNRNKKRTRILIIIISTIIGIIAIKMGLNYYDIYQKEQAKLKYEEMIKIEREKKLEKENKLKEEKRALDNIKRVENTIFINKQIEKFKIKCFEEINIKVTDSNKEKEYKTFFENKIRDYDNNTKKEIEQLCIDEAGKEKSAIKQCIENNKSKLQSFINTFKMEVEEKISNNIFNLKIKTRNNKIDKEINSLESTLKIKNEEYASLQSKYDEYYLENRQIPESLQLKLKQTKYDIQNINYKISHYTTIKNSNDFDITRANDLVNNEKNIINIDSQNKPIIQKSKNKNLQSIEEKIKVIQEKIDDAYINGKKPDSKLIEELEKLKGKK